MVIFKGRVVVCPSVQEVHAGASIATLTISRSLDVQGFLFEISQLKLEVPTDCADTAPANSNTKNRKVPESSLVLLRIIPVCCVVLVNRIDIIIVVLSMKCFEKWLYRKLFWY